MLTAHTPQRWAGALLLVLVCGSATVCALENLDTTWRIEQEDGFIMTNNTRCSGHYNVAGWNENGPRECQESCDHDSRCASFSLELNGGKGCFLFPAEASCTLEEGWVSGHKDTRCVTRSDNEVAHLKCPYGTFISDIAFASYGTPTGACGSFVRSECHSAATEDAVRDLCVGESECSLSVSSATLGGAACKAQQKRLSVQVSCAAGPEFNEDVYFNAWSSRSWEVAAAEVQPRRESWRKALASTPPYPAAKFSGKGVIVVAGGKYLKPALVMIRLLRAAGCTLPIQVWHLGEEEMTSAHKALIAPFNVDTRNFRDYVDDATLQPIQANVGLRLFQLKPLAILHSNFEDVLLLDSDNCPLRDPAYLFDSAEFAANGAVFWPDFWKTSKANPIHTIIGSDKAADEWEQESGQLLINKRAGWKALNLALHFNNAFYMKLLNGDKDTFRFAWKASNTPFFMVASWPTSVGTIKELHTSQQGFCGHTMLQHDLEGKPLFVHHNQLKNAHLPLGENFKYQKAPNKATSYRAVPVPGMELVGGGSLACTDISGPSLKNVDEDKGVVSPSNLGAFEVDYMAAQAAVSEEFSHIDAATQVPLLAANSRARSRREATENVTAACPLGNFELASNPVQCEFIADCSLVQSEESPPTATSDRECVDLPQTPTVTIFVAAEAGRVVLSVNGVNGNYKHAQLNIDTNTQYTFKVADSFPGDFTIQDQDGNAVTNGISNNGALAGEELSLDSSSANALVYVDTAAGLTGNRIVFSTSTYNKVYVGATSKNSNGNKQRFNTAFNPEVRLFEVGSAGLAGSNAFGDVRAQCKAQCDNSPTCLGVFPFYQTGGAVGIYCYGLNDLGVAMATEVNSQSWAKTVRQSLK